MEVDGDILLPGALWGKDLTTAPCLIEEVAGHLAGILEKGVRQAIQAVA